MKKNLRKPLIIIAAVFLLLLVLVNCFTIVNAGHTGVVVTLGKVNERVLK